MSAPADTLAQLASRFLERAEPRVLDAPLDAVPLPMGDEARDLLRSVFEAGEADSLRALLIADAFAAWRDASATPREEQILAGQLASWLGAHVGPDDPARLAEVPPLPSEVDALLAWARPFGLLGELGRPAREVLGDDPALPRDASLLECALGQVAIAGRTSALAPQRFEEEARRYLLREAASHAALEARAELFRTRPEAPSLRSLVERLLGVLDISARERAVGPRTLAPLHAVRFVAARPVQLDVDKGVARGLVAGDAHEAAIGVRLLLSGFEHRAIEVQCELCVRVPCIHGRALAARLVDACLDPRDRLHESMVAFAGEPSWKRFLRAVNPESTPEASVSRLAFRLRISGERSERGRDAAERVDVGLLEQRRDAAGRWSPGKLVAPSRALRSAACRDVDRAAVELLAASARTSEPRWVRADAALLRALIEHPEVELEGAPGRLRVVEQVVQVELLAQGDGLVPEVRLGGVAVVPGARSKEQAFLVQLDAATPQLAFAPLTPPLRRLLAALGDFRGVLPAESHPMLAVWLGSIRRVADVAIPDALRGAEREPLRQLLLRIAPTPSDGIDVLLTLRPLAMGALWPPGRGPELVYGLEGGTQVFARRDHRWEREEAARVIAALALDAHVRREEFDYRVEGEQAALEVLAAAARYGPTLAIEWAELAPRRAVAARITRSDLSVTLAKKGAWLSLEGSARYTRDGRDERVAVGRVLEAVRKGERFVPVGGGDFVELERALFERLGRAQLAMGEQGRSSVLTPAALPFVDAELGEPLEAHDAEVRALVARVRAAAASRGSENPEGPALPPGWAERLRSYQVLGVRFLLERSTWAPGVCLADEMGLGKTVQAIALLEARAALGPAIVIAPTSVTGNWERELSRFAPSLAVHVHRGRDTAEQLAALGPGSVIVTSYDLVLRHEEALGGRVYATQIVDEAQMIKNARTLRARAVARLEAAYRVALSGTPVENRLADLWSLFSLLSPGLFGPWSRFRGRFASPIEREEDRERAELLRRMIAPFVLRRTKDEVASELPPRTEVIRTVELSVPERDLYEATLRRAQRALKRRRRDESGFTVALLAEITRLRQLACHPRLVVDDARFESSKLAALLQLLRDILPRGHRALVFSQFTSHLALIEEALEQHGITRLVLDGSTPPAKRTELVARFQGGEGDVFLISLKAGGTGLNLTGADYVIHMDPWWNPAAEDQASDRAHRIGQHRPTTIVRLVSSGTIEERVLALHTRKRDLAAAILEGTSSDAALDADALEALLSSA